MAFPISPTDGDIHIKDGIRYIYSAASNSWTIQADPAKVAGNIKAGVDIDGVTGTFPSDGTAGVGDVLAGKTFYTTSATRNIGTFTITAGSRSPQTLNANARFWYYLVGKYYFIGNYNEVYGGQNTAFPIQSDATTRAKIAEKLGITIDSYGESNADSSNLLKTAINTSGDNWSLQDGGKILDFIKST